jgi:RNA polymerase sigma factor (sigma-70 family)
MCLVEATILRECPFPRIYAMMRQTLHVLFMSHATSDESLMLRYREGDLRAFEELYRRHHRALYLFISWRSPRQDWVDDIVQDSWANLHQARARYQPQAAFRTYLFQIARNRLIDQLRQHQRLSLASDMSQDPDDPSTFDALVDAAASQQAPEDQLEHEQEITGLQAALRALPGEQREAIVLQQFSGMSLDEIATVMEVPVETVRSRLRYAMKKLRRHLEPALRPGEMA